MEPLTTWFKQEKIIEDDLSETVGCHKKRSGERKNAIWGEMNILPLFMASLHFCYLLQVIHHMLQQIAWLELSLDAKGWWCLQPSKCIYGLSSTQLC